MKHHLIYLSLAALFLLPACQEQDMMTYTNNPAIYFANEVISTNQTQKDSIKHSFFIYKDDIKRDTVHVLVRVMGEPVDYDRPINLVQTNTGNPDAAIPGTHFIAFDDPAILDSIKIPAGDVKMNIPIVFLRDKSLATQEVRLELTLENNEHFRQGIDAWRNFIVTTTDKPSKPNDWDRNWKYTFGDWGSEKMRFIIQYTGFTDFDNPPSDSAYRNWLKTTAQQALLEYNAAHPDAPLCEADGTPVTFNI